MVPPPSYFPGRSMAQFPLIMDLPERLRKAGGDRGNDTFTTRDTEITIKRKENGLLIEDGEKLLKQLDKVCWQIFHANLATKSAKMFSTDFMD